MSEAKELTSPPSVRADVPAQTAVHDSVNSDVLLRGREKLAIRHNNEIYVLRRTRFGKLILTK